VSVEFTCKESVASSELFCDSACCLMFLTLSVKEGNLTILVDLNFSYELGY
jgi:hypothetical protein